MGPAPGWTGIRNRGAARGAAWPLPHPQLEMAGTLGPTAGWMIVVYLTSLALMLVTSLWRLNELSSLVEHVWGLQNFRTLWTTSVYRTITFRTAGMALA